MCGGVVHKPPQVRVFGFRVCGEQDAAVPDVLRGSPLIRSALARDVVRSVPGPRRWLRSDLDQEPIRRSSASPVREGIRGGVTTLSAERKPRPHVPVSGQTGPDRAGRRPMSRVDNAQRYWSRATTVL
jgi:hypothetical protein